ncbi:hypothetical protein JAAARDRAFT_393686 [Jaapia argillacea MUCL 33604]|uniref:Uncharacterized protein n=1 Tax=Jaapia argillacea MUCL 33604 TaxID=933084 RepID=A0A067QMJ8_9AGAM|nr:hypothetical protein JAAARDRAFT_393686 [Jaapia argillacea MUCL 33604]
MAVMCPSGFPLPVIPAPVPMDQSIPTHRPCNFPMSWIRWRCPLRTLRFNAMLRPALWGLVHPPAPLGLTTRSRSHFPSHPPPPLPPPHWLGKDQMILLLQMACLDHVHFLRAGLILVPARCPWLPLARHSQRGRELVQFAVLLIDLIVALTSSCPHRSPQRALKTRSVSDTWVPTGLVTGSQEDLAKYDKRTTSGTLGSLPRPPSYHSRPSRSESPLSSSFSASSNAHRDRSPHSTNPPVPPLPSAYNLRRQSLPPSSASDTDYHHYPPSENHSDTSRPPTRSTDTHEGRPLPHTPRKHTPPSKEYLRGDDGITKGSIQQEVHEVVNSAES